MITNLIIGMGIGSATLGTELNQSLEATLTATGDGTGVSILQLEVSETQTLEITSGTARFYTDAAGTLGESTTRVVTAGALRTIYLKAPSGDSTLKIPLPNKVTKWGNSTTDGWTSSTNAASITIEVVKLALTELRITGNSTLTGALPTGLTYLYLDGNSIAWTGLDVSGSGNITTFSLVNYRIAKMSSADMVTLLTSLTNRVGSLPATITINDYADYLAPPQSVTDAVAALKLAKPNITTVTLGA